MKAKTKNTMQVLLQGIMDRMKKVENFTLDQAPDICKEIVAVEVTEAQNSVVLAALMALLTGVATYLSLKYAITTPTEYSEYRGQSMTGPAIMCSFIGVATSAIHVISMTSAITSALRLRAIKAGPKLLIIEKLSKLIKKV